MSSLAVGPEIAMAIDNDLPLEKPRVADSSYQRDRAEYSRVIKQLQHILATRANQKIRQKLLGVSIMIANRGRAEIFALDDAIYVDISLLDLLQRYADELSVAEIKNDPFLHLEFNLAYAVALNGDKQLRYLDPYNSAVFNDEQKQHLWEAKLRAEKIVFENTLGFMIAHEISHLLLDHNKIIHEMFPDPESRNDNNPTWIRVRREIELAADELGSRICLNATVQPAQLLPWLGLNEIRRRYYGKSAEYPTSAQRIAIIDNVYNEMVGGQHQMGDLQQFAPLAPHKDILQGDYHLYLDEFRSVRRFGQNFLISIDELIAYLLKQRVPFQDIAEYVVFYIAAHKELLVRSADPKTVDRLIKLVSGTMTDTPLDQAQFIAILGETGISDDARELFLQELSNDPVNTEALLTYLELLKSERSQYDLGLRYDYLLANTYFRWFPELFAELIAALPVEEISARSLKPFVIGQPIVREPPSYLEKLNILRIWDGRYINPEQAQRY
jgi:hypothetical protein